MDIKMNHTETLILGLLKSSLFGVNSLNNNHLDMIDWQLLYAESKSQAVLPLILQGILNMHMETELPRDELTKWKKDVIHQVVLNEQLTYRQ